MKVNSSFLLSPFGVKIFGIITSDIVSPEKFDSTSIELEKNKIKIEGSISLIPNNTVTVSGNDANQLLELLDLLESHEDVQKVYSNFDIDDKDLNNAA